jgi:hypothetical protein
LETDAIRTGVPAVALLDHDEIVREEAAHGLA